MRASAISFALLVVGMNPVASAQVANVPQDATATQLRDAFDDAMLRLRGPIIDRALNACLTGEISANGAVERATAAGWPAFEVLDQSGERWRTSRAPVDENAAKIGLMVMDAPSRHIAGATALRCVILGPPGLAAAFQDRFDVRVSGSTPSRMFTVSNGEVIPAAAGSSLRVEPGSGIGFAEIEITQQFVAISIELASLSR